jgi:phosphate butyryltransferase
MKDFTQLIEFAKNKAPKKCVVVCANDEKVLEGIRMAQELQLISPVLVGNKEKILKSAKDINLTIDNIEIHDTKDENDAIIKSLSIVKEQGDFLMKGLLSSSNFLKGILDKHHGLRTGKILSHIAVLEIPGYHKLIFMSDGGMNPTLNLKIRIDIIKNAIETLRALGIKQPKIAVVAASETVNPDMPETTDAVEIVEMNKRGEIENAVIEGPFGFDVAVSKKAAAQKHIKSEIAGDVDFILMPNIATANIWAKGLIYFAQAKAAGMVAGTARPVIMLSRADEPETKLNSIALGVAIS